MTMERSYFTLISTMRKPAARGRTAVILCLALLIPAAVAWGWGFRTHMGINQGAIDILPGEMKLFYHLNATTLVAHAIDPDVWVETKAPGAAPYAHFIDLDDLDGPPFANIPRDYASAVAKYGEETLKKAGTLPWEIAKRKDALTAAFKQKHWKKVVEESAWLGHFAADSTMPLHATKNYKGQFSGNVILPTGDDRSVHQRFEVGLPEHFKEVYDPVLGGAANVKHLDSTIDAAWATVIDSYKYIPDVLSSDKVAAEADNGFGKAYYAKLDDLLRPVAIARIRLAQEFVASIWYTAWVDAGKPKLPAERVIVERPAYETKPKAERWALPSKETMWVGGAAAAVGLLAGAVLRGRRRRG